MNKLEVQRSLVCADGGVHKHFFVFFTVPEEPKDLSLVMISVASLNVSWAPPTVPNGIITKYEVSYRVISNVTGECQLFLKERGQRKVSKWLLGFQWCRRERLRLSASCLILLDIGWCDAERSTHPEKIILWMQFVIVSVLSPQSCWKINVCNGGTGPCLVPKGFKVERKTDG